MGRGRSGGRIMVLCFGIRLFESSCVPGYLVFMRHVPLPVVAAARRKIRFGSFCRESDVGRHMHMRQNL